MISRDKLMTTIGCPRGWLLTATHHNRDHNHSTRFIWHVDAKVYCRGRSLGISSLEWNTEIKSVLLRIILVWKLNKACDGPVYIQSFPPVRSNLRIKFYVSVSYAWTVQHSSTPPCCTVLWLLCAQALLLPSPAHAAIAYTLWGESLLFKLFFFYCQRSPFCKPQAVLILTWNWLE